MIKCPKCGKELNDNAKFCGGCGSKIEPVSGTDAAGANICPSCGNPLKPGAKFCGKCGTKLIENKADNVAAQESEATGSTPSKDFALVGQYIHWNILPGQLAVKIDENDIAAYGRVKGVNIQDGVKALFFVEGALVAELDSGSYAFSDFGVTETKKREVVKKETTTKAPPAEEAKAKKKGFFSNFINNISNHFKGKNKERAQNAGLTVRISASVPPVNVVLVRTIDFPLMFTFEDVPTANLKAKIALHLLCKISNINEFYKNQLLDNKFVSFEGFSNNIQSIIKGVLSTSLTSISCENISHNEAVYAQVLEQLQERISTIYPFIKFSQIISLTGENEDIQEIQKLKDDLYVSEQELIELSKRNNYLNRLASVENQQLLAEARSKVDYDAAIMKIDEDNQLNQDEREKFILMLAAQKKLREAQSENDVQAALLGLKKSGLLRDQEIDNLKTEISHNAALRDLGNSQMIALATMQNQKELDKEKLDWEISIGNKRIENQIERQRMSDAYSDERRSADAAFKDERRKAEMDMDKEEQLNQLELLRQAQAIRQEREDKEHERDVENKRLDMEAEKQRLDANLENQKIYSNMSAEQIMAANPNITPEAANAMAEKFKAEALAAGNDKTADLMKQQNEQMMAFMSQQMAAVRDMSMSMAGANNGLKDQMYTDKQAELNRVREDNDKNQNRLVSNVNTTAQAVAGALKGSVPPATPSPVNNVQINETPKTAGNICPSCGAQNEAGAIFCENCGGSL